MNDEQMEELKQYFGIVAEGLRNEIRQVSEGHVQTLSTRLDQLEAGRN